MKALSLIVSIFSLSACSPDGADWQHYRIAALAEAQDRNMLIFLHINDSGDPLCQSQKEILQEITRGEKFKKTAAFRVEFGTEGLLEMDYQIKQACTLLVFKGKRILTRVGRQGDRAILQKAITRSL